MAKNVTVSIRISREKDGLYWALAQVQAQGEATAHVGAFAKRPSEALGKVQRRVLDLTGESRRGRKPNGYKSLLALQFGWA